MTKRQMTEEQVQMIAHAIGMLVMLAQTTMDEENIKASNETALMAAIAISMHMKPHYLVLEVEKVSQKLTELLIDLGERE